MGHGPDARRVRRSRHRSDNGERIRKSRFDRRYPARPVLGSGDLINHLDTEPVQGLTLSEAVEKMRGKVGSDLKLTIRREGRDPFDVTVTRDIIKIRSTVRCDVEDDAWRRDHLQQCDYGQHGTGD